MHTLIAFYEALAAAVVGHIALVLAAIGVAILLAAVYRLGRYVQHGADLAGMNAAYGNGYDDGLATPRPTNRIKLEGAQVRGTVGGVEVRGIVPADMFAYDGEFGGMSLAPVALTPWRDVPAKLKADDAVREWRAERGLVAD
jgi:hypothetical protein